MSRLQTPPRLFPAEATAFTTEGIGALTDAISCTVTEERNGAFELSMVYPLTGVHFAEITLRSIIVAKPDMLRDPQAFRVYRITKPLSGRCTICAAHLSYDLSGIPVAPYTAGSAAGAVAGLASNAVVSCPFTFTTDKATLAAFSVATPSSIRSVMGGVEGSVLDVFGGEWLFGYNGDPYACRLMNARGQDNGVLIRYGKNLTDLSQEQEISKVYTAVYPYVVDAEGNVTELADKLVPVPGSFNFENVLTLDLTGEFETTPTEDQLLAATQAYINTNGIGVPNVSLNVRFVQLSQYDQYAGLALLEDVSLCDTVTVEFEELGVQAVAKVVKTVYNVLENVYDSVEIGSARSNIADTIAAMSGEVERVSNSFPSQLVKAITMATEKITGNKGGYVVLHDSNNDGAPDELLIMDTDDITTATNVWRWNQAGLGFSSTGYTGTYGLAMTADGQIVADFITTGALNAQRITMGAQAGDELTDYFTVDMDQGYPVVRIGAADNNIVLKLMNDRISFQDTQGTELAYFSAASFKIVTLQSFDLQGMSVVVLEDGSYGFTAAQ